MKILERLKAGVSAFTTPPAAPAPAAVDAAKRANGVWISRPVLNAAEWAEWAKEVGIPNPVAAADLHVTVINSSVDVKKIPDLTPITVYTGPGWDSATFVRLGPGEKCLCVSFDDYSLWYRHYDFVDAGAVDAYPYYLPHLTLSYDAGDFELTEEMMADAPQWITLGAEVAADPKGDTDPAEGDPGADDDSEDDGAEVTVVIITASMKADAGQVLTDAAKARDGVLSAPDRVALRDISAGHALTKATARRIAKSTWATPALQGLVSEKSSQANPGSPHVVEKNITITMRPLADDVKKRLGNTAEMFKSDDEEHLVVAWASVATIDGVDVEDLQGDTITMKALTQWTHDLMRGQRAGKFDHEGSACNEVVEAFVFSEERQKALGIDLGMEGVITVTHVPGTEDWAKVKSGKWAQSIAGRFLVEE